MVLNYKVTYPNEMHYLKNMTVKLTETQHFYNTEWSECYLDPIEAQELLPFLSHVP